MTMPARLLRTCIDVAAMVVAADEAPSMLDPAAAELVVDADGALITLEAGSWFVCFVPGLDRQWWHPLVNRRHKHVFAIRPAGPNSWTLFEPWWHRLLTATITWGQAKKFLLWGARGDVLLVREAIPGRGLGQLRGWMNCAGLTSYLLGRSYWVWSPHRLYKLLLREANVCHVDVAALLEVDAGILGMGSRVISACDDCGHGVPTRSAGRNPFCIACGDVPPVGVAQDARHERVRRAAPG